MAKLNIDFAVNLGNSVGEINKVVTALTNLNLQVNDLAKNLSSLSNKKIAPKVEAEIKVKETSIPPMKVKVDAEFSKGPLGNVFDRYIQGATNAKTVSEFLKEEEKRLTAEIKNLQQVAGNTTSLVKYTSALKQIGEKSKQLSAIKLADPFNKLSASANQANLTLVNVGRVAQDLPFGFLGIANNLNPLLESFKALKDEAKLAGTSVKTQLLASLQGFGGVGLAISAVSAALSFASVGLQYWTRSSKKGKEASDAFAEAIEAGAKSVGDVRAKLSEVGIAFNLARQGVISNEKALKTFNETLGDTFGKQKSVAAAEQAFVANSKAYIEATRARAKATVLYGKAAEAAAKGEVSGLQDQTSAFDKITTTFNTAVKGLAISFFAFKPISQNDIVDQYDESSKKILKIQDNRVSKIKKNAENEESSLNALGDAQIEIALKAEASYKNLGDFTKGQGDKPKTTAQKIADLYKEINDDLKKIASRRDLNPLEKAEKSTDRIKSGLDSILDLDIKQLSNIKFTNLEEQLRRFQVDTIKLRADFEVSNLQSKISRLREEAIIFNKPTIDKQISETESSIDNLKELYQDKGIIDNVIAKGVVLAAIDSVQVGLDKLNAEKLQEDIKNLDKSLSADLGNIKIKEQILDTSLIKDSVNAAEKALDNGLDLLANKLVQKTPLLKSAATLAINAISSTLNKLETERVTKVFKLAANYRFIGDPVESAKLKIAEYKLKLEKELSKETPDLLVVYALKANIENEQNIIDSAKSTGDKAGKAFGEFFSSAVSDIFVKIGEGIGNAFTSGDAGEALLNLQKSLGEAIKSFGISIITASKLIQEAKEKLTKGPVGILAGIALVAFGTAMANVANQRLSALKKASGGYISGPGSGTSDSIPARLSNGEYVVKARSVSKYGIGFLNAVNNGSLKKFATGGMVSSIPVPAMSSPNVVINEQMGQQVPYIATTQIKGQDLRLVLQRADSRYNRVV